MSRQMLILVGVLLVAFGSGIGVGLYMGDGPAAPGSSDTESSTSASGFEAGLEGNDRVKDNTLLSGRIRELEKELADSKQDQKAIQADRLEFFQRHSKDIRLMTFDGAMNITPEMVEILGLSKEEQSAMKERLVTAQSAVNQYVANNTNYVKQTTNSVSYEIPVNPQAKALKDQLADQLSADIGKYRAQVFMDYSDFSSYGAFSDFSAAKKTIDISWAMENGKPKYTVKNGFFDPQGDSQGWNSSTGDALPMEDQKLLQGNASQ